MSKDQSLDMFVLYINLLVVNIICLKQVSLDCFEIKDKIMLTLVKHQLLSLKSFLLLCVRIENQLPY